MLTILLILMSVLGIYIAWVTYQYQIIVRGIVGSAVIYLLSYYLKFSRTDLSLDATLSDPKVINHLIFALIGSIVAFWAFSGVLDLISFSIKWILSSK